MELVCLRDGTEVLIRQVGPDDKPLFLAGWQRFSDESRYRRFMAAKPELTERDLAFFTEIDHIDHEALGAIDPATGDGLGVARYVRNPDRPDAAEAAVAVIDAWQGRGVGALLLDRLTALACERGVRTFTASLLAGNHSMLRLFERVGTVRRRSQLGPTIEIDVELATSDDRTLRMTLRSAATGHVSDRRS